MTTNHERKESRQQAILDAALRIFSHQGYHETAVEEIASLAETSKGGLYFHFPGKQALFLALLQRSTELLLSRAERRMAEESDPVARADAALLEVLRTFASQRLLARFLLVEAMGAGREFQQRMLETQEAFATFISQNLDQAVAQGVIPPLDTRVAGRAWFGAINQIVTTWALSGEPANLEDAYPALRTVLLRGVGVPENRL